MTMETHIDKALVQALLDALNNQQSDRAAALLDQLTQLRESELIQQLTELSQNLDQTLNALESDTPILMHTKHDLPEVTERLQYVIDETQKASENTLASTELVLNLLNQAKDSSSTFSSDSNAISLIEQACSELTSIMIAQSYQDLTGQVLNRVILIMTDLELSLKGLIERSRYDYQAIPERHQSDAQKQMDEARGVGPNVTSKSKQDEVASQEDIDDLLNDLGI